MRLLSTARRFSAVGRADVGFRMTMSGAKALFFDQTSVMAAADHAEMSVLRRFGHLVRSDARQLIRKRKRPSNPGEAPTNQTDLLRRFIYYSYAPDRHSVVIGPTLLEGYIRFLRIPRVLEEGGTTRLTYRVRDRRTGRTKTVYGDSVRIRPRPYMKPAFDRQRDKHMPQMWRDSICRRA